MASYNPKKELNSMSEALAGKQLRPGHHQTAYEHRGNNLEHVEPRHPINTHIRKRVHNIDGFGEAKSSARPIRSTGGY